MRGLTSTLVAVALISLGVATAHASTPFGPDDGGFLTADKTKGGCENKVEKNLAKLWAGYLKCHSSMATNALAGKPFDEEVCEAAVITKWQAKTNVTNCPCVSTGGIAANVESVIDSNNNEIYCDPAGTPFGGDDAGNAPSTKAILGCENGLVKCWAKLVKGYVKCHTTAESDFLKSKAFDEETCEQGPLAGKSAVEVYSACVGKVLIKGGCQGCEALVGALTDSQLDGANGLVYCESPSGAFLF